jgi:hypothetical protein
LIDSIDTALDWLQEDMSGLILGPVATPEEAEIAEQTGEIQLNVDPVDEKEVQDEEGNEPSQPRFPGMIQTGILTFTAQGSTKMYIKSSRDFTITFPCPFNRVPQVGIMFVHLDCSENEGIRVYSNIVTVTKTYCVINAGTANNSGSEVNTVKLQWIASTNPGLAIMPIQLGSYPKDPIQGSRSIRIKFPTTQTRLPKVMMGLNYVDMDRHNNRRVEAWVENLDPNGFNFLVNVWGGTKAWTIGYCILIILDERIGATIWSNNSPTSNRNGGAKLRLHASADAGNYGVALPFPGVSSASYSFGKMNIPFFSWSKFQPPALTTTTDYANELLEKLFPVSQFYPLFIPTIVGMDTDRVNPHWLTPTVSVSLDPTVEAKYMRHVLYHYNQWVRKHQRRQPQRSQSGGTNSENGSFIARSSVSLDGDVPVAEAPNADADDSGLVGNSSSLLHLSGRVGSHCRAYMMQCHVLVLNRAAMTGPVLEEVYIVGYHDCQNQIVLL